MTRSEIRQRIGTLEAELYRQKALDQGGKIQANGCYGKLGSTYSVLYAPHLMISVTLTGQLSLLMLIERAEQAGVPVVSGNTDGVLFLCPRNRRDELDQIIKGWEADTGFGMETAEYEAIYNSSVNSYVAVKPGNKVKLKGPLANPWREGDLRAQMMKNPQATVCSDAVVDFITKGVPIEETIRNCTDIRSFVTVVNVAGGATWCGDYLGKVVRYYWAIGGAPIFRLKPHPSTGNHAKVPKTDGCRPAMQLPEQLPLDIDYDRYISEANELLFDLGWRPDGWVPPVAVPKFKSPLQLMLWAATW